MKRSVLVSSLAVTIALPCFAQIGSVVRAQKLNEVSGGIVGPISRIGHSLAAIGDLNGDGVGDLVAGLPQDDTAGADHGALLVLFLDRNGTVKGQQKISERVGGFTGSLPDYAGFGIALVSPGDLDGDGLQELAVRTDSPRATWILFLNASGTVRAQRVIYWSSPVFGGGTEPQDFDSGYVRGLVAMGDLDGDGRGDLALGAPGDDDGYDDAGAVWFLYLNPDGSAKAAKKISETTGGLTGKLGQDTYLGDSMACLGDVDGDGFADLSVAAFGASRRWLLFLDANENVKGTVLLPFTEVLGTIGDLDGDGIAECASEGMIVRFLAADGQQRKRLLVLPGQNGMPVDPYRDTLAYASLAPLGDLGGDGTFELAVSDLFDKQSGGAVWILSLVRTAVRNGSGRNPLIYREISESITGQTWQAVLDCRGHQSGPATVFGFQRPLSGRFVSAGEVLVDLTSTRYFMLSAPHTGGPTPFSAAIPPDPALVGLRIYSQGACGGWPGVTLSNALDLLVSD